MEGEFTSNSNTFVHWWQFKRAGDFFCISNSCIFATRSTLSGYRLQGWNQTGQSRDDSKNLLFTGKRCVCAKAGSRVTVVHNRQKVSKGRIYFLIVPARFSWSVRCGKSDSTLHSLFQETPNWIINAKHVQFYWSEPNILSIVMWKRMIANQKASWPEDRSKTNKSGEEALKSHLTLQDFEFWESRLWLFVNGISALFFILFDATHYWNKTLKSVIIGLRVCSVEILKILNHLVFLTPSLS